MQRRGHGAAGAAMAGETEPMGRLLAGKALINAYCSAPLLPELAVSDNGQTLPQLLHGESEQSGSRDSKLTPLHLAALNDDAASLRLLLEHGAKVNAASTYGLTALHAAAANGNREIVALLLQHGADPLAHLSRPGTAPGRGDTPLDLARRAGHRHCAELIEAAAAKLRAAAPSR